MASDDEVQAGGVPGLERIVKVAKEAKPVVLAHPALLDPFTDSSLTDSSLDAWTKPGFAAQIIIKSGRRLCRAPVDDAMRVGVEPGNGR